MRVVAYTNYLQNFLLPEDPDSTIRLGKDLQDFSQRVNYPYGLANAYYILGLAHKRKGDYNQALDYLGQCLQLRRKTGDSVGVARCLNASGNTLNELGEYIGAVERLEESLRAYRLLGDTSGVGRCWNNLGNVYTNMGNNEKALDCYLQSLEIDEHLGNEPGRAATLNNIGNIYYQNDDFDFALDYYKRSLEVSEKTGDRSGKANCLLNIANVLAYEENYSESLDFNQMSLAIRQQTGQLSEQAYNHNLFGFVYWSLEKYEKALEHYHKALEISNQAGDRMNVAFCFNSIGALQRYLKNLGEALVACHSALEIADEIDAMVQERDACKCLYKSYKDSGDNLNALRYHEWMVHVDNSLNSQAGAQRLQQMEFEKILLADSLEHEQERLQIELDHQREVRNKTMARNIALGSGVVLLLLAGGLYNRYIFVRKSRSEIEKERDRSDSLLLNILPAEIAKELKERGKAEAQHYDLVNILFTDFKEFTQTTANVAANLVVNEINICFQEFDSICGRYGIEKIKTIGDAYMAAGGVPVPDENSVVNTIRAALEMQKFICRRREELMGSNNLAFEMRLGIHSGPVVAGIVGVKKFQYDIWGDTVNTASRMEHAGEVGKVNISETTYELVKHMSEFRFEPRGRISVKGKGEVGMYFVFTS